MALNLPLALRLEKNKLVSTAPWLLLAKLTTLSAETLCMTRNTEDVVFNGDTYIAWDIELGELRSSSTGKIEGAQLRVANPERALVPYLEAENGLIGCTLSIQVVHADNLSEDHSELRIDWQIMSTQVDADAITFALGAENPYRKRFPLFAAIPNSCPWIFKGAECAYAGAATECNRTLARCRELNNAPRFGGRPGLTGATRFV